MKIRFIVRACVIVLGYIIAGALGIWGGLAASESVRATTPQERRELCQYRRAECDRVLKAVCDP